MNIDKDTKKLKRYLVNILEFNEIYCNNCKKILGRYNVKYYPEAKIAELIKDNHAIHVRKGHEIIVRRTKN